MHAKKQGDLRFKIKGEGKIRGRDEMKPKVLPPCRAELGLGSWLFSHQLKEGKT